MPLRRSYIILTAGEMLKHSTTATKMYAISVIKRLRLNIFTKATAAIAIRIIILFDFIITAKAISNAEAMPLGMLFFCKYTISKYIAHTANISPGIIP